MRRSQHQMHLRIDSLVLEQELVAELRRLADAGVLSTNARWVCFGGG